MLFDQREFDVATLSAMGVSVLLMHSATALHLVKFAGACSLVWSGVQFASGGGQVRHDMLH